MKKIFLSLILLSLSLTSCQNNTLTNNNQLTIGAIQGCGHISPYNGKKAFGVEGVVTHKYKNGFTMQSIVTDSLLCTSDAIFVATGVYPNVYPGQLVKVDGKVNEYISGTPEDHNLSRTEIKDATIKILQENAPIPNTVILGKSDSLVPMKRIKTSITFDTPKNGLDYYESLEFMLVEVQSGIVVGPKNPYNEFIVLPDKYIGDNLLSKQGALLQTDEDENPEKIMIDAASSFTKKVNIGDTLITPIIGIMDYSFGNFKIWTIKDSEIQPNKIILPSVLKGKQNLSIISYNIENYSRFDETEKINKLGCQFVKNLDSPDIIMLHEILDDSGTLDDQVVTSVQSLEKIIEAIRNCGGPRYYFIDNPPTNNRDGGIQGENIRTAIIYREDSGLILDTPIKMINGIKIDNEVVTVNANPLRLFSDTNEFESTRKPSLWVFTWRGEQYLLLGMHLVSQSASSPLWGELQPPDKPEEEKRVKQMQMVSEFASEILTKNQNIHLIIMGDFNDYPWSETLNKLNNSIMVSVLKVGNDAGENYSYIHEGNAFQFDYAVVSNRLLERVTNYSIVHLNTLLNSDDQISDHDPIYFEISD